MRSFIACKLHEIFSAIKLRRMRWAGHTALMGKMKNAYNILVVKSEWKGPLGRPMRRWEENIRLDLREIGWEGVDWMHLAQDKDQWRVLVNTVMNLRFHKRQEIS
jgi:hypothetical protein